MGRTSKCLRTVTAVVALALGTQVEAQDRAGVVTTLEGHVTVARASLPRPAPLKFKDDIFVRDRIATSRDSVARILLGGRAVVTVREHSTVSITEAPGVATIDVAAGRVAVAVAREKMRAGDVVEVKTPNAVAGIRGTVIVAEVFGLDHSVVTVLKGTIEVTRLEAGRRVGAATIVDAFQRVSVAGRSPVSAPEHVAPAAARQLGQEFRLAPPRVTPSAASAAINAGEVARVANDLPKLPQGMRVDKADKAGKLENGGKARLETPTLEAPPAGKSNGRAADALNAVGDATKGNGRRNRDRDR